MAGRIPKELSAILEKTWRNGIVDQFDTEECYFHALHARIGEELRRIPGCAAFWETEEEEWAEEFGGFQSYHVFFLSPKGEEFRGEDETTGYAETGEDDSGEDDPLEMPEEITVRGERTEGYALGISLAAPVAVIQWSSLATFEDGSFSAPDIQAADLAGEPPDEDGAGRGYSRTALRKMKKLRNAIAAVLQKYHIALLDDAVPGLIVPGLRPSREVFLDKPVRVLNAFFFRGV